MPEAARRIKDEPPVRIDSHEEVDRALRRLCEIEAEIRAVEARLQKRVLRLRAQEDERLRPIMAERDSLVRALTRWVEDHRDEVCVGRRRSRRFTHGVVGIRKEAGRLRLMAADKAQAAALEAEAVERLLQENPHCVKVVRKVLLGPLRALGPEVYEPLGYRLVGARSVPYVEPAREVIEDIFQRLAPKE